ncbi:hypothetical protein PR048_002368 [Dryococelus australis]|uniref:Uncharacterized protein n=1 Tax=Dryococelus australis TaxID=614101 RepID=A0ABQ9IKQ1_9NEOP|nr:hypothetical protein PR048_002368 [Dryococelus australis]
MSGRGKRAIPEKTRRPTASFGRIPTCGNPVTRPGIEPGSPCLAVLETGRAVFCSPWFNDWAWSVLGRVTAKARRQDGVIPHSAIPVRRHIHVHSLTSRNVGRERPTAWPPRSPDVRPHNFWWRGYIKSMVYATPLGTRDELMTRIRRAVCHHQCQAGNLCNVHRNMLSAALSVWPIVVGTLNRHSSEVALTHIESTIQTLSRHEAMLSGQELRLPQTHTHATGSARPDTRAASREMAAALTSPHLHLDSHLALIPPPPNISTHDSPDEPRCDINFLQLRVNLMSAKEVVRPHAYHHGDPGSPDFRMWESCQTMPQCSPTMFTNTREANV